MKKLMSNFFERFSSWQKAWPSEYSNNYVTFPIRHSHPGRLHSSRTAKKYKQRLDHYVHFRWGLQKIVISVRSSES